MDYRSQSVFGLDKLFQEVAAVDGLVDDDLFHADCDLLRGQKYVFERRCQLTTTRKMSRVQSTELNESPHDYPTITNDNN